MKNMRYESLPIKQPGILKSSNYKTIDIPPLLHISVTYA